MGIFFATSNKSKFAEALEVIRNEAQGSISIRQFPFNHNEIRSDSLEEIARESVESAYFQCKGPVFVEDSGLFINALNGFPGTYSGWAQRKIGNPGILKLLAGEKDRSAYFEACIAYNDGARISTFHGRCEGKIAEREEGASGFGYDPIFIPAGHSQTFAQSIGLKNKISHRYLALLEFSKSNVLRHKD